MPKIFVFTEDSYGVGVIEILKRKLHTERMLPWDHRIKSDAIPGLCSSKFKRALETACEEYDKVVILVDAHGEGEKHVKNRESVHVPDHYKGKAHIIVNKYEIEEWILYAKGHKIRNKPSEELKKSIRYEKHMLPDVFRRTIDNSKCWRRLMNYAKFKELLKALTRNDREAYAFIVQA